jgi:MoxR-like ATPase
VSIDPSSLFGRRQPSSKPGVFPWVDGPVTWIVRNGGVLNISEINFMTPKIAASLYPLLDGRRYIPLLGHEGEVVRAHIGTAATSADGSPRPCWCDLTARECNKRRVLIIADMNPNYRGTMELNAAFKNRFEFKIPWNYDSEVEEKLIHFPTMRKIAGRLRELAGTDIMTPVSTNMMMEFEQFSMSPNLSLEFAVANFVSAFLPDEQNSVQNVFDLNKTDLSGDIAYFIKQSRRRNKKVDDDDDAEEIDFDFSQED